MKLERDDITRALELCVGRGGAVHVRVLEDVQIYVNSERAELALCPMIRRQLASGEIRLGGLEDMRRTYTIEAKIDCHDEEKYKIFEEKLADVMMELKANVGMLADTSIASVRIRVNDPIAGVREVDVNE